MFVVLPWFLAGGADANRCGDREHAVNKPVVVPDLGTAAA